MPRRKAVKVPHAALEAQRDQIAVAVSWGFALSAAIQQQTEDPISLNYRTHKLLDQLRGVYYALDAATLAKADENPSN